MTDADACTIRFVRPSQYADWLRSYELRVNGTSVGKLARNDALEITVPAGACTIEASIDWGRSHPLIVRTAPGETVEIEVKNRWGAWAALWAISFGRNSYLVLTKVERKANGSGLAD
ncbi:hypothetical protein GWG65_23995 [Bradyrhizobium sp. CSA207]|uniref:hypothetical protein n=1 Tax=Bradyrhizobium sp. CSA207 TaxID=2698826 RepID=UPI0023B0E311|nr:hypothetical protein [Bradyrhizobium sp. CSA207]MDE5444453.1 hypothetical protein [Bradyrhizobium sp. CSA207]